MCVKLVTLLMENGVILPGAITNFCCCAFFKHCPKVARSPTQKQCAHKVVKWVTVHAVLSYKDSLVIPKLGITV